ncbi:MAG: phosphatase PAP2 family protein [Flavisolibacter sp.]|nr:phosphatase PAP2 family protein [Flavisolibacter sp.]
MKKAFLITWAVIASLRGFTQQPDTLIKKLDSLSKKTDSAGGQVNNTNPAAYNEATKITFPSYFILLGSDLKQAFTKPFHMTREDWFTAGKFAVVAGGVSLFDKSIQRKALKLRNNSPTLQKVSKQITNFGGPYEAYTLGALGAYGFIFKNGKMKTTTLLASQAYITGGAVESVLKYLSGRQRPYLTDSTKVQASPTFHGPFYKTPKDLNGKRTNSSFPSGHTTVAFAAATVYAMEYKNKPLVPILAYSAATLIGLSRITENKHWATDVLTGAALGYLTGKLVVNNYHRYAKLKAPQQKKNTVTFNLQYNSGVLQPGLIYTFR